MKTKIFRSTVFIALLTLLAAFLIIMSCLYNYFSSVQENQMRDELNLATAGTESRGTEYLESLEARDYRLTWISSDGEVLFDSHADEESMENHSERREIRDAFSEGSGSDSRYSSTLMEKTLYYAEKLEDGTVLRISVSRATIWLLLMGMLQPVIIVIIIAVILSAVLAGRVSNRITKPLNNLDLDNPLENDTYEELSPMLQRINLQEKQIRENYQELRRRKEDFEKITSSMEEGLVLLDGEGRIVSINPAAQHIFNTDSSCVGEDFLTIERNYNISEAYSKSIETGHCEIRSIRDDVEYQFDFSRIEYEGETAGCVLLVFDVTEQAQLEQSRREFTANVSHELKTPLQSIMGSAELIENGLVKPEDMPHFVGSIRRESARLVTLIDDIIHLSQIESTEEPPLERVNLTAIAREALDSVSISAAKYNLDLSFSGQPCWMQGVPGILFELCYNLCDNAVKYNVEGGSVKVSVADDDSFVFLKVSDTGIGIAPEHINRVFERFYRVDKSHSRQSGGTGLGLSIVKHAAACHHAEINIESSPGQGTAVSVKFPKALP
ncbi:MAG: ATP-binding protein [Candidatus Limivicinus sp.]|jgi:two-component system phosphate regulon sensor histidine kinase PhoR